MSEIDLQQTDSLIADIGTSADKVLPILQALQKAYGYLPQEALERVCETTDITPAAITGFSSFYDQFRFTPPGEHMVRVCVGTACHVKGAQTVYEAFLRHLKVPEGGDTDPERRFTVERVACLGCCTLAPAVQIGEVTYGHLTADTVGQVLDDFLRYEENRRKQKSKTKRRKQHHRKSQGEIRVGLGSCCQARGSGFLNQAIEKALRETGIQATLKHVGCVGMCYQTPLMDIVMPNGDNHLYAQVKPEDAKAILLRHFKAPGLGRRVRQAVSRGLDVLLEAGDTTPVQRYGIHVREKQVANFLDRQQNIASEHCGNISPTDIDEYLSYGGFDGLRKAIHELSPTAIVAEIEAGGLRGRGGRVSPPHASGRSFRNRPSRNVLLSATAMRGILVPLWIVCSWNPIPCACWRGWPLPPGRSGRNRALSMFGPSIPWRFCV